MQGQTSKASETIVTPLGAVLIQVSGSATTTIALKETEVSNLPKGMAIDGVVLCCIRIATPVVRGFPLRLSATVDQDGGPEPGEWLESMSFSSDNGILQVATRESSWLAAYGLAAEPVQMERNGFSQTILEAPAETALFVSVAWRLRDGLAAGDDGSTWFAADLALPYASAMLRSWSAEFELPADVREKPAGPDAAIQPDGRLQADQPAS
jgi:hypothetical protein